MDKLKVVELFAGVGAWAKSLENLGIPYETVLAVEHDPYPITGYNAIHRTNFETIDITKLNEKDVPDCDIICYSPPCQAFSAAGKQLGFDDKRGILFFDALRIIKAKKPKYTLMENVKNLTQKKFKNEFLSMLDELEQAGYNNYWKVINALDHNVNQNRERVFVISIRKDIEQDFEFPSPVELKNQLHTYLEEDATTPILHNIYGGFNEDTAREFHDYSPTIRTSAGGGHIPSVMILDDTYKGKNVREYIEYSPTIGARRKGFKVMIKHNNKYKLLKDDNELTNDSECVFIRDMSNLEAFRLMGFTDQDYEKVKAAVNDKFYKGKDKSQTRMYKMAGNSIVVNVCEELFKELLLK
jgi:DNA-cytosine methyltransferase